MMTRDSPTDAKATGVMLIHGLGQIRHFMWPMARRLRRAGWPVALAGYPSMRLPIEAATERVGQQVAQAAAAKGWNQVHLVGHSLGGLIARRLATTRADLNIGRVVQIGSPNGGTPVAEFMSRWAMARWILGPVLTQVTAFPRHVPVATQVGAIGGTGNCRWLSAPLGLHGPSDGMVPLRSAWAGTGAGMHVATSAYHTALPFSARTADLVAVFLATGNFTGETT